METLPPIVNPAFATDTDEPASAAYRSVREHAAAQIARWQNAAQNRMAFHEAEIALAAHLHHYGLAMRGKMNGGMYGGSL